MIRCQSCRTIATAVSTLCNKCGASLISPNGVRAAASEQQVGGEAHGQVLTASGAAPPRHGLRPRSPMAAGVEERSHAQRPMVSGQQANAPYVAPCAGGHAAPVNQLGSVYVPEAPAATAPPAASPSATFATGATAPPLGAAQVVLGPASDPSISVPSFPGPAGAISHSTPAVIVGPAEEPDRNRGLKIAALVISSLVLVTLIVVAIFLWKSSGPTPPPTTTTTVPPTTAPAPPTTAPPATGSVSITAETGTVRTNEAATIRVHFQGDQTKVTSTRLVINNTPVPEVNKGLRNEFVLDAGDVAGSLPFKVIVELEGGNVVESNELRITIAPPTTQTTIIYVPETTLPPPAERPSLPPSGGSKMVVIRPGHTEMGIRVSAARSARLVRNVDSGDTSVYGVCTVKGDWAPAVGNAPAGDNWIRLTDGNYFWDSWAENYFPSCSSLD